MSKTVVERMRWRKVHLPFMDAARLVVRSVDAPPAEQSTVQLLNVVVRET
jgi:hypothetical protein